MIKVSFNAFGLLQVHECVIVQYVIYETECVGNETYLLMVTVKDKLLKLPVRCVHNLSVEVKR